MKYLKKVLRYIAYFIIVALVSLSIYTFVMTDLLKKDYVNVFGYTYFVVSTGSMSGAIEVNDIIFVKITDDVKINDIISYKTDDGVIITHRLVQKIGDKYITQGDANNASDEAITKDAIIGKLALTVSPSFILKALAVFIIVFILLSLINFDKIVKKYVISDNKKENGTASVPEEIFYNNKPKEEKSTGLTVSIPVEEINEMQHKQEKEVEAEENIEVLDTEDIIDISTNNIVTKENNAKQKENEILELVINLLRVKNNSLETAKINKKWLVKYQYVYKIANFILLNDSTSLCEEINHPPFKEIYNYDLEKVGLYENLRNKIYDMPIYIFLKILTFSVLYNDEEFFDGIFKIMKYKIQIDKNGYFKEIKKNDNYGKKQLKLLIEFMRKISLKFDNKNVFELERIERLAKLKSYANK